MADKRRKVLDSEPGTCRAATRGGPEGLITASDLLFRIFRTMIRQLTFLCVAILCIANCGCIRVAAETVLTVTYPEAVQHPDEVLGIWDFYRDDGLLWGVGWHPREHETYILPFLISEPSYRTSPRVLSIKRIEASTATPNMYEVTLALDPDFTPYGEAPSDRACPLRGSTKTLQRFRSEQPLEIRGFLGKRYCELNKVVLERIGRHHEVVYLSARIVARQMPEYEREWLEESGLLTDD